MDNAITIPCTDQCDPECKREHTFHLDVVGLSQEQIDEIEHNEGSTTITLSPEQMEMNNMDESHPDYSQEDKGVLLDIYLETACVFCVQ